MEAPAGSLASHLLDESASMLWAISIALMLLWVLGLMMAWTLGGFIHILLVLSLTVFLVQLTMPSHAPRG